MCHHYELRVEDWERRREETTAESPEEKSPSEETLEGAEEPEKEKPVAPADD